MYPYQSLGANQSMYTKSLSFFAAVFLFAGLIFSATSAQSQAAPAAPPAGAADLNAKAHAIFDKGVQLNGLTAKDMQPYHLKATYELYEGDPRRRRALSKSGPPDPTHGNAPTRERNTPAPSGV